MPKKIYYVYRCGACHRCNYVPDRPFPPGSMEWQSCDYCHTVGQLSFVEREEQDV